jgi:AraC-like DNA-binding protein
MLGSQIIMSKTLAQISYLYPLQLDYFQPGTLHWAANGWAHRKTMPYSILVQTLQGHYQISCEETCFKLSPGQAALIPANSTVEFEHHGGKNGIIQSHWVHFRFSYCGLLDYLSLFKTPFVFSRSVSRKFRGLIQKALLCHKGANNDICRHVVEYSLASRILELVCSVSRPNQELIASQNRKRLLPVLHYIHDNLHRPLSIQDLARQSALSSSRFHSCFSDEFGLSPMRYVKKARLEAASRMLAGSDFKLEHISNATGFADAFHLSHSFKKYYGMAPKAYRIQANAYYPRMEPANEN